MQALRNATLLARLVLAWFAFAALAAGAAPMPPPAGEWVCSGGAMKVLSTGDGTGSAEHLSAECALCVAHDAPPPGFLSVLTGSVIDPLPAPIPVAQVPVRTSGPAPGRGPPL